MAVTQSQPMAPSRRSGNREGLAGRPAPLTVSVLGKGNRAVLRRRVPEGRQKG